MNTALSVSQAAVFLGLAKQTLYNHRFYGTGPAYHKLGSRIVYRVSDLEEYLAKRRIDPEARQEAGNGK